MSQVRDEGAADGALITDARRAAELAARASYGRLVAYLAARSRDVASAEDALGDAFVAALETWPRTGVPHTPEAWLLAVARRRLIDGARHANVQSGAITALRLIVEQAQEEASSSVVFPDERLKLLFVCADPAIDESVRTPLMLQTVLGMDAARIASAFLISPTTMGQRLVRAKARIRDAALRFDVPEPGELSRRLEAVLDAIYAAYGSGWDDVAGADPRRRGLAEEAIWLGRLVTRLLPDEPETSGLLALMLHCEARRGARRAVDGAYVPLTSQDVALWSHSLMDEAEQILASASRANRIGRFQLEAAIQSVTLRAPSPDTPTGRRSRSCTKGSSGLRRRSAHTLATLPPSPKRRAPPPASPSSRPSPVTESGPINRTGRSRRIS